MNTRVSATVHLIDDDAHASITVGKLYADRHRLQIGDVAFVATVEQLAAVLGAALNQLPDGGLRPVVVSRQQLLDELYDLREDPRVPRQVRDAIAVVRGHIATIDQEGDQP